MIVLLSISAGLGVVLIIDAIVGVALIGSVALERRLRKRRADERG
jgi:hypothetical protein